MLRPNPTFILPLVLWPFLSTLPACADVEDDDAGKEPPAEFALTLDGFKEPTAEDRRAAMERHPNVDPTRMVPRDLLENAVAFFDLNAERIRNKRYVTVIDYSKHSSKKRFFIVDMASGSVEPHVVAHGSGSDPRHSGFVQSFSNVEGSNASSNGFYLTAETYQGRHGYSLRLDGVSSTNSRARSRAVVIHGADYVENGRSLQGRSWGCPALPDDESRTAITKLKDGSVLYVEKAR